MLKCETMGPDQSWRREDRSGRPKMTRKEEFKRADRSSMEED